MATRVAIASTVIAALVLGCGALWMRAVLFTNQQNATEQLAGQQADSIITLTQQNVRLAGDYGPLPYELVASDGAVVSASAILNSARTGQPLMPVPDPGAENLQDIHWPVPAGAIDASTAVSDTLAASAVVLDTQNDRPGGLTADGTYRVYVFATPTAATATVTAIDPFLGGGVLLASLLVGITAALAVRRAIRPVELIRLSAERVSGEARGGRVPVPARDDEFSALARTINDMLERLDTSMESQQRFSADAAHELRTPIASTLAALEIARMYPDQIDRAGALDSAISATQRLQRLAQELLQVASGRGEPFAMTVVDGAAIVRAALADRPGEVETHIDSALIRADVAALERAIRNLIDNATRHALTFVTVTATTTAAITGMGQYSITVHNDGPSIPLDWREKIFQPFARTDDARSRDAGGAGLGLAIARDVARRHGGDITVEPDETLAGVSFVLTVPVIALAAS